MIGLEQFKKFSNGYESYDVVIGETACALLTEEAG